MQVVADMDVSTRLSGASLNLFYSSWNRLLPEMVRRVVTSKKNDPLIRDFFKRCADRGVEEEFIRKLDTKRTKAVRSIGSGSMANRLVSLRELQGISGQFDDVGRRNLTRDIVSTRVGHDLADRYVPANEDQRPTVDLKIAYLENQQLQAGQPVPVVASELHGQHLQIHVPLLQQILEAINTGQVDPQQSLSILQALYQHISETLQFAAGDPALQSVVASTKQSLQYAEEAINNTTKALEKIQREQAQMAEQSGQQPQVSEVDMKLQKAQVDMQIAQQKAELDMAIKQKKFDQEQAMRDAKAALEFRTERS
jgi:hypothetical protein